jgi:hypothetical protein
MAIDTPLVTANAAALSCAAYPERYRSSLVDSAGALARMFADCQPGGPPMAWG